jgi:hypothetical protein
MERFLERFWLRTWCAQPLYSSKDILATHCQQPVLDAQFPAIADKNFSTKPTFKPIFWQSITYPLRIILNSTAVLKGF